MGGSHTPSNTTSIQTQAPPQEFLPAYYRLFNSAFGAAQQASGSPFQQPIGLPGQLGGGAAPQQQYQPQNAGQAIPFPGDQTAPPQGLQPGQYPVPGQLPAPTPQQSTGDPRIDAHIRQQNMLQQMQYQNGPASNPYNPASAGLTGLPQSGGGQQQGGQQQGGGQVGLDQPGQIGIPGGYPYSIGSPNIPLAGGYPIVGQAYQGPFTAPTTPVELQSLFERQAVGNQLAGIADPLLQMGSQQASGQYLNPNQNPYFAQNLMASLQPAIDAFTRNTAPQFNSQALQSGAFKGSSARDFAFGNLANDFGRNLLNTAAQTGMQNYTNERAIQQQTPQLLQQAAALQQVSPEILAQVGAGQRELMQRPLDEALLRFQEAQAAPFRPLNQLASIIQGTNIGGVANSVTTGARPSPLASGIAGSLGGGALGLQLANQLGYGTGAGGAVGGGLGALLGGLAGGLG